jgi:hypothetical protein
MRVTIENIKVGLRQLVEQSLAEGLDPHEVRSALLEISHALRKRRSIASFSEADLMIERAVSDLRAAALEEA